ncbi:hypothetical protein [Glycomyces tarimensis]
MTPEELHRAVLGATAFGDDERYARLRRSFGPYDARSEFEHLEGAAAVCLAYRLGDAGPSVTRERAALGRFMAELRGAEPGYWSDHGPPGNFLEVEAVIRGLRGEGLLIAEIGGDRLRHTLRFLVRYLTGTVPEIRDDFDTVIDRAREHVLRRLIG